MRGFGSLSNTDENVSIAVDELISETQDRCALEQLAKINCASFTDANLPSDVETRFRKLKSFSPSQRRITGDIAATNSSNLNGDAEDELHVCDAKCANEEGTQGDLEEDFDGSSPLSDMDSLSDRISPINQKKMDHNSLDFEEFMGSTSPPRKGCCFWCSPKRENSKKGTNNLRLLSLNARAEEDRMNKEAAKIVNYVKHASARFGSDIVDDIDK